MTDSLNMQIMKKLLISTEKLENQNDFEEIVNNLSEGAKNALELLDVFDANPFEIARDAFQYEYCTRNMDDAYLLEASMILMEEFGILSGDDAERTIKKYARALARTSKNKKGDILL